MPKFKVWDPQNESLCSTTVEHEANSASEAAEKYAADDSDGMSDGVYVDGYDIMTRSEDGIAMAITVTVEPGLLRAHTLPDGYSIHVFTMPADEENDECEMYQWEHVSGEVSGHLEGDKFVRDSFGSWDDAVADIREQQILTD